MAKETVIIGCKLPAGLVLEVGYTLNPITGAQERNENYRRIVLRGWHAHTEDARRAGIQLPAGTDMRPFLNRNIDKAAWEAWKAAHKGSWLLRNEILFEASDEPSAQLRMLEAAKTPTVFAPIDREKPMVPGITQADFTKEKVA